MRGQLVVVDPDAQVAVGPAAEDDVADSGNDPQAVAQIQIDVGQDVLEGTLGGGDGQPHDRVVVGVELLDGRRLHVVRQLYGAKLRVGFLQRGIDVLRRVEGELDRLASPWRILASMSWMPWTEITACSIGLTISVSITSGAALVQLGADGQHRAAWLRATG